MNCGGITISGKMAKEVYNFLMKESEKAKANKESNAEKRKKRLKEFEEQMKKKQRP